MMTQKINICLSVCTLLFLSCCGFPQVSKEAPETNELPPNSKFTIILPENHTTGYIWQLSQNYNDQVVRQINEVWHGNEKGIYFNLQTLSAGQTTLNFVLRKYTDTSEVKSFIIKIAEP
jgi:predicted secreted protein